MISAGLREKWRPTLGLIVFAVLASVMVLPLVGLFFFRLYDNQLIRQTQAELIERAARIGRGDREAFAPCSTTARASSPSSRTASSAWPSSWRGAPTTSRPSRPT